MALVVITGGARSGKSGAAQRLAESRMAAGSDVVVVVFGDGSADEEMAARIECHRRQRPKGFTTLEVADAGSWRATVPDTSLLLLDCLGTLTARIMAGHTVSLDDDPSGFERTLDEALREFVSWLVHREGDAIVVTNEVGAGVVPAYASGRVFRDSLGRVNAMLATVTDASYLAVCGRLIDLASLPRDAVWPGE